MYTGVLDWNWIRILYNNWLTHRTSVEFIWGQLGDNKKSIIRQDKTPILASTCPHHFYPFLEYKEQLETKTITNYSI